MLSNIYIISGYIWDFFKKAIVQYIIFKAVKSSEIHLKG